MNFLLTLITVLAIIGNLLIICLCYIASKYMESKDMGAVWVLLANTVLSMIAILTLAFSIM